MSTKEKALDEYFRNSNSLNQREIAEKHSVDYKNLCYHIRKDSRYSKDTVINKSSSEFRRYSQQTKNEALDLLKAGETVKDVANAIGCEAQTIRTWKSRGKKQDVKGMFPEMESMRKEMFDKLQNEFISLSTIIEDNEQKRQYVHEKMVLLGENWSQ